MCVLLETVDCVKYFGIHFNYTRIFKFVELIYHINNLIKKLFYKFCLIKRNARF